MVDVYSGSLYRRTGSPNRLTWSEGRRPLGAVLHSSNEPDELSQWICHDDTAINIVLDIIIIIIIIIINISVMSTLYILDGLCAVTLQAMTTDRRTLFVPIVSEMLSFA